MSGTILIVDAVATNRIVLKVKLASAHFGVTQAVTGRDAVQAALRDRPDMIIANAALPDLSSRDMIAALRAHPDLTNIPVVLLLNVNTQELRLSALQAGADDVITQPLDERILLARIRSLLRQHHAMDDLRHNA